MSVTRIATQSNSATSLYPVTATAPPYEFDAPPLYAEDAAASKKKKNDEVQTVVIDPDNAKSWLPIAMHFKMKAIMAEHMGAFEEANKQRVNTAKLKKALFK